MNAIVSKHTPTDLTGCRIYQTQHPCIDCAKLIVQSGIKTIYYLYEKGKEEEQTAKILLDEARVTCSIYKPKESTIVLFGNSKKSKGTTSSGSTRGQVDEYLEHDDFCTALAELTSRCSKDPSTKVGACIVMPDDGRVVGVGYNDFPPYVGQRWKWDNDQMRDTKYPYIYHAAASAYMNRVTKDVKGADFYTTLFPCNECVKLLIQAGIKRVFYASDEYNPENKFEERKEGTQNMMKEAKVDCSSFDELIRNRREIMIDFTALVKLNQAAGPEGSGSSM